MMTGRTLAHYEVESPLGEGGSGVVYRGRDLRLERPVAIKVLSDALRDDELAWGRLLREARLASQLNHPHIAGIYDLGEEEGRAYIVMEYVEGLPLADLITDGGMPIAQVARYGTQIAAAVAFAHEHGIIHGDLKGSNILVTPEGSIKLLDFGLGRRIPRNGMAEVSSSNLVLEESGATAGTLPYLSPEVLRGAPTSLQSDMWALGVLLYQMATGELPFRGSTSFDLSLEIMVGTAPEIEELPEGLQALVRRCLEKEPEARISQMSEVVEALKLVAGAAECAGATGPEQAAPAHLTGGGQAPVPLAVHERRRWRMVAAGTAIFLLLATAIYARHVWGFWHAPQQALAAEALKAPVPAASQVKVWVNTDSDTYHCPGSRWYGKTHAGEYMTQKQAQTQGYRPAAKHACM